MMKTAAYMPGDLNRLERETGMMLATVDSLSEDEMRSPSLCEGWTRAHVIAELIGNADALGNLITSAVTGTETPMYESEEARDAQREERAELPSGQLKQMLHDACKHFAAKADQLRTEKLTTEQVTRDGGEINAYTIPAYRISEVLIHHLDLDTLWELEEADIDALDDALDFAVTRLQSRDDWPGLTIVTDEGDEYTIGDGTTTLNGGRDAILGWLTRGITHGVRVDGELPERPKFA